MLRGVMEIQGQQVSLRDDTEAVRPPHEGFIWVDVLDQQSADLALLGERFGFHPLALEDCEHLDQRPKLEEYNDHIFMVMHSFTPAASHLEVNLHELHIFFSTHYLVTVHTSPHPALEHLWLQLQKEPVLLERGGDFLLYRLFDMFVDANFPTLEILSSAIEEIEDSLMTQYDWHHVDRFMVLKRSLSSIRRVLSPQRELVGQLLRRESSLVSEHNRIYFRDIYDHLVRLNEMIDVDRDLLANARDAHFAVLSQRTNDIMRRLTLVSIVFLPLTFITGFFGMNFAHMPFENDLLLFGMLISIVVLPVGMLFWFHKQHWFS